MSDWLELELAHHLSETKAPDALWERIQAGPRRVYRREWPMWPIAAILTVMVAAGAMWMVAKGEQPGLDLRQLAAEQLSMPLELRSGDPAEITRWARREAGLDLALAPAPSAELLGARVIRHRGECIAAVSYRIDGRSAALLVARAATPEDTPHGGMSWQTGGQAYALASSDPGHAEAACRICHSSL